jgi:hypothetical protein
MAPIRVTRMLGISDWLTPSSSAGLGCLAFPAAWPTSWDPASPEAGGFVEGGSGIVQRPGAEWAARFIPCG